MAGSVFSIESDKIFLCCDDLDVIQIYEIDNLHLTPVQEEHFTFAGVVTTVDVEGCLRYEAIRIGNREIIEGRNLEKLMKDLFYLGMIVNREGLCFLKQESRTSCDVEDECRVNYYRMFDQFDWSNYDVIKVKANTRWICNDIVTGRPMFERDLQSVEKLSVELMEMKLKHTADMEELERKHLDAVQRKMEAELNIEEVDQQDDSNINQIAVDGRVLMKTLGFLAGVVEGSRFRYPCFGVRLQYKKPVKRNDWKNPSYEPDVCTVFKEGSSFSLPLFRELWYHGNTISPKFDSLHWWVVRVVRMGLGTKTSHLDTIVYYDGDCSHIAIPSSRSVPVPMHCTEFEYVSSGQFFCVVGVGVRYGFPVEGAVWKK